MRRQSKATRAVAPTDSKPLILGRISGLYGVKGWVKVHSYTAPREAILKYESWLLEQNGVWRETSVAEGRKQGKTIVARLDDVTDRDVAATYVGTTIGVARADLPETDSGEYYWTDLEGLQVVHTDGRVLGKVAYILATGANDVLVVQGDQEILVPFVKDDVIKDVDLAKGIINVDWDWD
jgi:16S rRNA processing protein RimM